MNDLSILSKVDSMINVVEFMQHIFPWIALLFLLFTTVIVMLAEKRRRALVLDQSDEEKRIRALSDIGEAQKEELLKAVASLPSTKEAFPLPDLPLRLVSAFSKVFGFLKILLLLGSAYSLSRIARMPNSTLTSTPSPVIVFLVIGGFIVFAIGQIVASRKVTRGSNGARRILIFIALLDLGASIGNQGMSYAGLWRATLILMSGYTLWILFFRKQAQEFVTYHFSPTRIWQKITVLCLCLLFAISTPFDFTTNVRTTNSCSNVESNWSMGSTSGITLPISRVYLQAGDASRETLTLMQYLKEKIKTPTELIEFKQPFSHTIMDGELYFLVSKTLDQKIEFTPPQLPRSIRKKLIKSDPNLGSFFQPHLEGEWEIAFKIETPFSFYHFVYGSGNQKILPTNRSDIQNRLSATYTGSRQKILDSLGDSAAKDFNKYISDRDNLKTTRALPDFLTPKREPLAEPPLDCMTNAIRMANYTSPAQQISLYCLSKNNPETVEAISNQLASADWNYEFGQNFEKGNEKITLRGPASYARQHPLPHLFLIHSKTQREVCSESDLIDFCQHNYSDFIGTFYAKTVPEEVLKEATLKYLKQPDLSARELYTVYNTISFVSALDSLKPDLLYRFAKVLHQEPLSEQVFRLYQKLGSAMTVNRIDASECYDKIAALYGDQITHLQLEKDTNGLDRTEITLKGIDQPLLITVSKTRNDPAKSQKRLPFFFLYWLKPTENGKFKSYYAYETGSGVSENITFPERYMRLYNFSSSRGSFRGVQWGEANQFFSTEDLTKNPGSLTIVYSVSPKENTLTLKILFNDNSEIISRSLNGNYILNKDVMTDKELVAALKEKCEKKEKFGLIVVLNKAERATFKKYASFR